MKSLWISFILQLVRDIVCDPSQFVHFFYHPNSVVTYPVLLYIVTLTSPLLFLLWFGTAIRSYSHFSIFDSALVWFEDSLHFISVVYLVEQFQKFRTQSHAMYTSSLEGFSFSNSGGMS